MMRLIRRIGILAIAVALVFSFSLMRDRQTLKNGLVRLHVVGQSDSEWDQNVKLSVRDAVLASLSDALREVTDMEQAKQYIQTHLSQIEEAANHALRQLGVDSKVAVSFLKEQFPTRNYETFSLPSGIYQSLRITIGEGKGQNWWCVVFPTLCMGASAADVEDVAAGAGFPDDLAKTITGVKEYKIRFYLLEALGKLENFFYRS